MKNKKPVDFVLDDDASSDSVQDDDEFAYEKFAPKHLLKQWEKVLDEHRDEWNRCECALLC